MTSSVKRGLQVAKDLLHRRLSGDQIAGVWFQTSGKLYDDIQAAIRWIARQEKIDARRGPRNQPKTTRRT